MFSRMISQLALIALCLVKAGPAFAGQSITIQGRVVDSSGNPVNGASVVFRVQILSPLASRCVLYDESQTLNLSGNSGLFSINLGNGSGTVNPPATYTLEQALSNRTGFSVSSTYCASGTGSITYSPLADDNRKVVISFRDPGSMTTFESIPEMDLNPMAFAIESRAVGGYPASSLLKVEDAGVLGSAASLTSANFAELQALLAGNSSYYMSSDGASSGGAKLPSYAGNPSSSTAGSMWFDTSSGGGVIKYKDSSGTVRTVGVSGGSTITSVTATDGLTASTSSGAVTIGMETLATIPAGTHGSATTVPVFNVDIYGRVTSVTDTTITGTLPSGTSGQFLRSGGGSAWSGANIGLADLHSTISGPLFDTPTCTSAQTLYWNSGADAFRCQSIAALDAAAITTGTVPAARLPASASYWESATGGINFAGGNVGVGTTAPLSKLHLVDPAVGTIYLDAFNGRAGFIGRSAGGSPGSPAALAANANIFAVGGRPYNGTDYTTGSTAAIFGVATELQTSTANGSALTFGTTANGTTTFSERMRIDQNGSVGIGTTNPTATGGTTLEIYNAANTGDPLSNATLRLTSVNRNANVQLGGADSSGYQFLNTGGSVIGQINYNTASNTMSFQTNGTTTRMTIDSSGNVGVGTTLPQTTVDVLSRAPTSAVHPYRAGIIAAAEGTDVGGRFGARTASPTEIPALLTYRSRGTLAAPAAVQVNDGLGALSASAYDGSVWSNGGLGGNFTYFAEENWTSTNHGSYATIATTASGAGGVSAERVRITGSGNVGIATTSPNSTLEVNGTAAVGASLESITAYTNTGAAYTIPDATKNIRRLTLDNNTTITLPAFATPADKVWTLTVMVKQDTTGSRTLAFAAASGDSILWDQSATAPAPQSAASKISIYQFTKASDETTWYGSQVWKQN